MVRQFFGGGLAFLDSCIRPESAQMLGKMRLRQIAGATDWGCERRRKRRRYRRMRQMRAQSECRESGQSRAKASSCRKWWQAFYARFMERNYSCWVIDGTDVSRHGIEKAFISLEYIQKTDPEQCESLIYLGVFDSNRTLYAQNCRMCRLNQMIERCSDLPIFEENVIIRSFTEFCLAHFANASDLVLGNIHGKYRTSAQTCSSSSQAKRSQFQPAFDLAYSNQSCS